MFTAGEYLTEKNYVREMEVTRMKRTFIGATIFVSGILQTLGIIISGVIYLPHVTSWSTTYPSKLIFTIMAGNEQIADDTIGLGLGWFFVFGIALILLGLGILLYEYFRKD